MNPLFEDSASGAMMTFYIAYFAALYIVALIFGVIGYILGGISLSTIARRRGIEKPWLAWVPVGNVWLLGCISDQYRYVVHGQETNRRGKLLTLSIVVLACSVVVGTVSGLIAGLTATGVSGEGGLSLALILLLLTYGLLAVAVFQTVLQYMSYFDLFRSCDPDRSLVYLLVSIFASFPLPFFVFICRNKDLGMPPRTDASLPEPSFE